MKTNKFKTKINGYYLNIDSFGTGGISYLNGRKEPLNFTMSEIINKKITAKKFKKIQHILKGV